MVSAQNAAHARFRRVRNVGTKLSRTAALAANDGDQPEQGCAGG